MELVIIPLLYGGGILTAFVLMVIATVHRERFRGVLLLSALSLLCLFAQHSCWRIASDIGRATGGGGGSSAFNPIVAVAFAVVLIWILALVLTTSNRP